MPTIETDLNGLKHLGKEFLEALPEATPEEAEAGWKCFSLAYLGATLTDAREEIQAQYLFKLIAAKKMDYDFLHGNL